MSKQPIDSFLERFLGMKFLSGAFAQWSVRSVERLLHLYPFDKPIKALYFCSFVVFVLFVPFHFKVIRKSLY